jgi:SAM-dependent methyltransferase
MSYCNRESKPREFSPGFVPPSIWIGSFDSFIKWKENLHIIEAFQNIIDQIDDSRLKSRHPFQIKAWCSLCNAPSMMQVDWSFAGAASGSINPAWTETATCISCKSNSRTRAALSCLSELNTRNDSSVYICEKVTPLFKTLKARYPNLTGSEYINKNFKSGQYTEVNSISVMHQDLTESSFESNIFDRIISLDVFEHIPNYKKAFSECYRILKTNGCLVFSIPFFPENKSTSRIAFINKNGDCEFLTTPEYHGNPVGDGKSLCFQHFGWDILDDLRCACFEQVSANLYWSPIHGHLGLPYFIFTAKKIIQTEYP